MREFLVIAALLLLLAGCQTDEDDLNFSGSGENWSVELTFSVINGSDNNEIEIKYNGKDLDLVEPFNYYVENTKSGTNFGADNLTLNRNGIYTNDDLSSNSPTTTSEDTFDFTVERNGTSESFVLKKNEFLLPLHH
ncbi:hypothetical protein WAX74_15035 [Psychrobacillus sp. FJAT-51614]|uniref:Uncharacterized protein n=1 Tax=Psychrobacillus mangrovi TaxID=3117745 RepID=A0ABU8FA84_9BACI